MVLPTHNPNYKTVKEEIKRQRSRSARLVDRVGELEQALRESAQIVHQAYHEFQGGTWMTCPSAFCRTAQRLLISPAGARPDRRSDETEL